MKYLLDTHTFLWLTSEPAALSQQARDLLEDLDNELYLSIASLWEIAIKVSIGKLLLKPSYESFLAYQLALHNIAPLPATLDHFTLISQLPQHHKDPFDRLIAAQSLSESLPVLSIDDKLDRYGVQRIW